MQSACQQLDQVTDQCTTNSKTVVLFDHDVCTALHMHMYLDLLCSMWLICLFCFRNVKNGHLAEIFGTYGTVKKVCLTA
jgi:hypothetical protein